MKRLPNFMLPEKAFKIIEERITQGKNIVELGSGDGTKRLSERYNVISIEHDENWISQLENSHIFAPIIQNEISTSFGEEGWYDISSKNKLIPNEIDLLLIDGPPGWIGRRGILGHSWLIQRSKFILIDDTDRSAESELTTQISKLTNGSIEEFSAEELNGRGEPRRFSWINRGA
ncbi:MAG: hypothetical protein VXW89_06955 [Candidatus Thermoplasmatota archaeon]|nr:hypothetical protein [Candidatus Thermoplasmatota archaeon]